MNGSGIISADSSFNRIGKISFHMTFPNLLIINALFLAIITVFAYGNVKKSRLAFNLFLTCLAITIWSVSFGFIFYLSSQAWISVFIRISNITSALLPVFILHFVFGFVEKNKIHARLLYIFIAVGVLFSLYSASPLYSPELILSQARYFPVNQVLLYSLVSFNLIAFILGITVIGIYYGRNLERLGIPVYYLLAALGSAAVIAYSFYLWFKGYTSYPWGAAAIFIGCLFAMFSVFRKELPVMENFEVAALVNLIMSAALTAFFYFVILAMEAVVIREIELRILIPVFTASFLILLFVNPFKNQIEKYVYQLFFPEVEKQKEVSSNFSKEIVQIMNREDLFNYMINTTGFLFFIKKAAVFVMDENIDKYVPETTVGIKNPESLKLKAESNFIRYLEKRGSIVFWDRIEEDYRLIRIKEELEEAAKEGIRLWFPLISRGMILAIFGIGQKENGEYFNAKDMELLSNLISGATIALENIRLYELTQKLRELDEMKKDFVSSVTHELKSPLTAIQSCVDYLLKKRAGDLTRGQMEYLVIIQNNSARLTRFISALLDIARIESAKIDLYLEETNLISLAQEIVMFFSPYAGEKGIKIHLIAQPEIPPVQVDQDKIKQVLTNLLSNSIKFTEHGEILIRIEDEEGYVKIDVQDSGAGIPADAISKLFNKFYQVRETHRVKHYGGTGLGLAIVKGIVEAHGGNINVESEVGNGTTFTIRLPKED